MLRGSGSSFELQEHAYTAKTKNDEGTDRGKKKNGRRLDEVERVGDMSCRLTTSKKTKYNGRDTAVGTIFTIQVKDRKLELLGLEFNAFERASDNLSVLVYYQYGDFSGSIDNPEEWTLLADTTAKLSPDKSSAIIPAAEFEWVELQPGRIYSFYLHFASTGVFRYTPADSLIGETFDDSNDLLDFRVGVTLTDTDPFPNTFDQASNFNGIVHYRTLQSCMSVVTTTDVDLHFAINNDPNQAHMSALAEAVEVALTTLFRNSTDTTFSRYEKNHMLELASVESNFQGRSTSMCPNFFERCSLISTTVGLTHLQTLDASELQTVVLKHSETIRESVVRQMDPVETEYVGLPIQKGEYLVTLKGVPSGQIMNAVQKRYFERIATDFYRQVSKDIKIYRVEVTDEVALVGEGDEEEDGEGGQRLRRQMLRNWNPSPSSLRQRQRKLVGETQIVVNIYGQAKTISELLVGVFETIDGNEERFVQELALQQLRPGEINTQSNFGAHFANVFGLILGLVPPDFGQLESDDPVASKGDNEYQFLFYFCFTVLGLAAAWLLYRVYKDCCSFNKDEMINIPLDRNLESAKFADNKKKNAFQTEILGIDKLKVRLISFWSGILRRKSLTDEVEEKVEDTVARKDIAEESRRRIKPTRSLPLVRRHSKDDLIKYAIEKPIDPEGKAMKKTVAGRSQDLNNPRRKIRRGVQPSRSMPASRRKHVTVGEKLKRTESRNQAGRNGRGAKPSKSLPTLVPRNMDGKQAASISRPRNMASKAAHMRSSSKPENKSMLSRGSSPKNRPPQRGKSRSTMILMDGSRVSVGATRKTPSILLSGNDDYSSSSEESSVSTSSSDESSDFREEAFRVRRPAPKNIRIGPPLEISSSEESSCESEDEASNARVHVAPRKPQRRHSPPRAPQRMKSY